MVCNLSTMLCAPAKAGVSNRNKVMLPVHTISNMGSNIDQPSTPHLLSLISTDYTQNDGGRIMLNENNHAS